MHPADIKSAFGRGDNISQLLRQQRDAASNTEEIIEIAYDLQAGSYIDALKDEAFRELKQRYSQTIAREITSLCPTGSAIEVGVGECTTMAEVMSSTNYNTFHGFDISWSRVATGREWLSQVGHTGILSVASIFNAPYTDDSFDIVYTSHSIEPNGGSEAALLTELLRITARYVVLIEPGYEFANPEAKLRMERLGYVRGLADTAMELGMNVVRNEPFEISINQSNPSAITVIEKAKEGIAGGTPEFACPNYGDRLTDYGDALYSSNSLMAYPKIGAIPCLRKSDGVVASRFLDFEPEADEVNP